MGQTYLDCYTYSSSSEPATNAGTYSECTTCQKMVVTWASGENTYIRWCGSGSKCTEGVETKP